MTLTLDDVRNTKFRIARRAGYEVMDVDQFVDQVEEAFAQMSEQNGMLRQQVDALKSAPASGPQDPPAVEPRPAVQQQPAQQPPPQGRPQQPPSVESQAGGERLVVTTSAEASQAAHRLVQMAEKVVTEAEGDADKIREDARREAHQITTDARTRAERSESEARVLADRVTSESKGRADQLDRDLASKRADLLARLETERDQLNGSVQKLRDFESTYRTNIASHLKSQLAALDQATSFEPENRPDGVPAAPQTSDNASRSNGQPAEEDEDDDRTVRLTSTPRLDALLGDNRG